MVAHEVKASSSLSEVTVTAEQKASIKTIGTEYKYKTINNYHSHDCGSHSDQKKQEKQFVLQWLSGIKDGAAQRSIFKEVAPGTGVWFLKTSKYEAWQESQTDYLWATAMCGAGKTHIFSVVVNHLKTRAKESPKTAVVYFYCRYSENYGITDILGCLLKQLIQQSDAAYEEFLETVFRSLSEENEIPGKQDLQDAINASIPKFDKVYILLDGIDELSTRTRGDALEILQSFKCSLFLMSRDLGPIGGLKPNFDVRVPSQDFRLYMSWKFGQLYDVELILNHNSELVKDLMSTIEQKSDGMFLLAALQVKELENATSEEELRTALKNLPEKVGDFYGKTLSRLNRLDEKRKALAHRILLLVTHARRPLTTHELREALAVPKKIACKPCQLNEKSLVDGGLIVKLSCGLIRVEGETETVHLTHYTTKEFLDDLDEDEFRSPHEHITALCLSYLQCRYIGRRWNNQRQFIDASLKYPFMSYALRYLGSHARDAYRPPMTLLTIDPPFPLMYPALDARDHNPLRPPSFIEALNKVKMGQILRSSLFCSQSATTLNWLPINAKSDNAQGPKVPFIDQFNASFHIDYGEAVHFASLHGISPVIKRLSDRFHTLSEDERTPLHYAIIGGHEDVVRLLLQSDSVDVNHRSKNGHSALFEACIRDQKSVVKMLLDHPRIMLDLKDNNDMPLLHCAIHNSDPEIVRMLLNRQELLLDTREGAIILQSAIDLVMNAFTQWLSRSTEPIAMLLLQHPIISEHEQEAEGLDLAAIMQYHKLTTCRQFRKLRRPLGWGVTWNPRDLFIRVLTRPITQCYYRAKEPIANLLTKPHFRTALLQGPDSHPPDQTIQGLDLAASSVQRSAMQQLHSFLGIDVGPQNRQWDPPQVDGYERQLEIFKLVMRAFGFDDAPTSRSQTFQRMLATASIQTSESAHFDFQFSQKPCTGEVFLEGCKHSVFSSLNSRTNTVSLLATTF